MIYEVAPPNFAPKYEVVGCFCESRGKILLLHRLKQKLHGGKWGAPAGKVNQKESVQEAMIRELQEETGIGGANLPIEYRRKDFVRYPDCDFVYHIFSLTFPKEPAIRLSPSEHQDFKWVEPGQALGMDLVPDHYECIKMLCHI